jgi:uncharacterized membrane protein
MNEAVIKEGKTAAITSYILFIGVLIALSMNSETRNRFAAFHIRQALGLTITFFSLGLIVSNFDNLMITFSMWVFISVLWSYGFMGAIQGKTKEIPLLGKWFQKVFQFI